MAKTRYSEVFLLITIFSPEAEEGIMGNAKFTRITSPLETKTSSYGLSDPEVTVVQDDPRKQERRK